MKSVLLPTDVRDPQIGDPLYVQARDISFARYLCRIARAFCGLAWRRYESERIGPGVALKIARAIHPYDEWRMVRSAARAARAERGSDQDR